MPRDARVGVRRAHEHGVHLARESHVVRIAAEALDEPRILDPAHRLADGELLDDDRVTHDRAPVRGTVRA